MKAEIYLVFDSSGKLIQTRLLTAKNCFFRSIHRATDMAELSRMHIDLGSFDTFSVYTKLPLIEAMRKFDDYCQLMSVLVTEIDID